VPVGTSATVIVSLALRGWNHSTCGFWIVVPPLRATIIPDGRRTSSWCTLVATPNRVAIAAARPAPLPAATGSTAIRTSRVSITSPPVPNTVPISNDRGSNPRPRHRASAAVTPVASLGGSVSTTVQSCSTAGRSPATLIVHASPPSLSIAAPPVPSGRTVSPPRARRWTWVRPLMISTVTSGRPSSVNVNRVEYRMRSLSVAEVSSARAGNASATTATDARTERGQPAGSIPQARQPDARAARKQPVRRR